MKPTKAKNQHLKGNNILPSFQKMDFFLIFPQPPRLCRIRKIDPKPSRLALLP